jgi:predicted nucleic acid-binding protein
VANVVSKSMPSKLIVADAGPLIALAVAEVLPQTIALYKTLLVPAAVVDECTADPTAPGAKVLAKLLRGKGIKIISESDISPLDAAYAQGLGSGEVAVLAYAAQHQHIALIDERRARRIAQRLQVPVVGSGAVLLALKASGSITSVKPGLEAWATHGYFVAATVVDEIIRRAGEG